VQHLQQLLLAAASQQPLQLLPHLLRLCLPASLLLQLLRQPHPVPAAELLRLLPPVRHLPLRLQLLHLLLLAARAALPAAALNAAWRSPLAYQPPAAQV
jgi:hypothetical protein